MLGNHGPRSPTAEGDIPDFVDCDTTDSSETFSDEDVPIIHALPALALPTDEKKPQLTVLESELGPDSPVSPPKKLRILMLHGFTQSGDFFQVKTARLRQYLLDTVLTDDMHEYPGGIEFLYPTGCLHLRPSDMPGAVCTLPDDGELHAWWRVLNVVDRYHELENTMTWLVDYVRRVGPIDGVIGFSQGAVLGMMLASLCEGYQSPQRRDALASQGAPIHDLPPQPPLKFAVSFCGFRGTIGYYEGFYNPKIVTPSMLIVADLDTMVSEERSSELIKSCHKPVILRHQGGHFVPSDRKTMNNVAGFVKKHI